MTIGFYSYIAAAVAYGFFAVLLLFSWRCSLQGKLLFVVMSVSAVWSVLAALVAADYFELVSWYQMLELGRYMVWYIFLLKLLELATEHEGVGKSYKRLVAWILPMSVGFALLLLVNYWLSFSARQTIGVAGQVFLALIGLVIIEQLYRNIAPRYRWATKYLFLGAGGIFAFDFYFFADALLFRRVDQGLWESRAVVSIIAVPLLAISSARNKNWSLNVFVSRDVVFNSSAILGGGIYLMLMAAAGYYIKVFGGDWGTFGQAVFISLAILLLAAILFSGQARARLRVFLAKHFYKNKYDYREEWLQLTGDLTRNVKEESQLENVISTFARPIDAKAGQLWLKGQEPVYRNLVSWNMPRVEATEPENSPLVRFFHETGYIINLKELNSEAQDYAGLEVPAWLNEQANPWLVVPLFAQRELTGFIVLASPLISYPINWEDRDLLKTAAKQVANHIMVLQTSDALAEAKQFELFSRLSAYMVHDLKNIASELELVALNADRHKNNPAFIDDAIETVENAAGDIRRLLEQLRNKKARREKTTIVPLHGLIAEVVASRQVASPKPQFESADSGVLAEIDASRLSNVLAHLIDNSQQATADDGDIRVRLSSTDAMTTIEIEDTGTGMDEAFIRDRLFKAFDTTKGNAGMGIGMFESREYIRQIGGDIKVLSSPGKGTIITLEIPLCSPSNENETGNMDMQAQYN